MWINEHLISFISISKGVSMEELLNPANFDSYKEDKRLHPASGREIYLITETLRINLELKIHFYFIIILLC